MMPSWDENVSWMGDGVGNYATGLVCGSQGSRSGSGEEDVPDGIVAVSSIPISSAPHLVVSKHVSGGMTLRAGVIFFLDVLWTIGPLDL